MSEPTNYYSYHRDLATLLKRAQGVISEDGVIVDIGAEVISLRNHCKRAGARIAELEELLTAYESMESKVAGLENDLEKRGVRLCRRQK